MSRGQQPRLESLASLLQGPLEIEATEHPILACAQGQVHEWHRSRLERAPRPVANLTTGRRLVGRAVVDAADDALNGSHDPREPARRRTFRAALVAPNQNTANTRIDRAQQKRRLELLL